MKIFSKYFSCLVFSLIIFFQSQISGQYSDLPKVFLLDGKSLAFSKERILLKDSTFLPSFNLLYQQAESTLTKELYTVTQKKSLPPGGDIHDYMSLGPYWWPDPEKPDGLPYIRKDGEVNPEVWDYPDKASLVRMSYEILSLGLTYYLTGEEKFSAKAVEFIRAWFLDEETRMNPNLKYAQVIPGRDILRGIGILEARHFSKIVDAIGLIQNSSSWSDSLHEQITGWFEEYFTWLTESEQGLMESAGANNHGTWFDVQALSLALFLGKKEKALEIADAGKSKRIDQHIEPDGSQPEELIRTRALSYSAFNLEALFSLAFLAEHAGVDLWNYKSPEGASIIKAFDFVLPYVLKQKEWPYQQISKFEYGEFYPLLVIASAKSNNVLYKRLVNRYIDKFRSNVINIIYSNYLINKAGK